MDIQQVFKRISHMSVTALIAATTLSTVPAYAAIKPAAKSAIRAKPAQQSSTTRPNAARIDPIGVLLVTFNYTTVDHRPPNRANMPAGYTQEDRPFRSVEEVRNLLFGERNSLNSYLLQASNNSYGITGTIAGNKWYMVNESPALTRDAAGASQCSAKLGDTTRGWIGNALSQAKKDGFNPNLYDSLFIIHTYAGGCIAGEQYQSIVKMHDYGVNALPQLAPHEYGHRIGYEHANTLTCTNGGVRVSLSDTCSENEGMDPIDPMGAGTKLYNAAYRAQYDWIKLKTVDRTGTYTLPAYTKTGGEYNAIKISPVASGQPAIFLEYRTQAGGVETFDSSDPFVHGVSIRTSRGYGTGLVDATPETETYTDAALPVGRTVAHATRKFSIKTVSISPDHSSLTVCIILHTGDCTSSTTTPKLKINQLGLVNSADYSTRLAPGAIASMFGVDLTTQDSPCQGQVAEELCGTTVIVGGKALQLFYVSKSQINFYLPKDLPIRSHQFHVSNKTSGSDTINLYISDFAPAIYTQDASGKGAATIQNFRSGDGLPDEYRLVSKQDPAYVDTIGIMYATGLNGRPVTVRLNGNPEALFEVLYGGSGQFAGQDQINFKITKVSGLRSGQNTIEICDVTATFCSNAPDIYINDANSNSPNPKPTNIATTPTKSKVGSVRR